MILTPRCGHNEALASGLRCSLWRCNASVNGDMPFCVWLTRSCDICLPCESIGIIPTPVYGLPGHMIYISVGIILTPVHGLPGYVIYMSAILCMAHQVI